MFHDAEERPMDTDIATHADATINEAIDETVRLLRSADALLIGAGAGMSADSGIAVYRGPNGRYSSPQVLADANADAFAANPDDAAEAYRQRYADVLSAAPHEGYAVLNCWRQQLPHGAYVYTSNVDAMFLRSGFPEHTVYEVHGALAYSQCLTCADMPEPVFASPRPDEGVARCPTCGAPARPNILMFGDYQFHDSRRAQQWDAFAEWSDHLPDTARVVIIELGAGTDVATVRTKCESLSAGCGWPLVRINLHEPALANHCAPGSISLPLGALDALQRVDASLVS